MKLNLFHFLFEQRRISQFLLLLTNRNNEQETFCLERALFLALYFLLFLRFFSFFLSLFLLHLFFFFVKDSNNKDQLKDPPSTSGLSLRSNHYINLEYFFFILLFGYLHNYIKAYETY